MDMDSQNLTALVVRTLHKTFEYDQDGEAIHIGNLVISTKCILGFYQSPGHFRPVSTALLSQLGRITNGSLAPDLMSAIAQLAVATDSATHHKELNISILQHMRSDKGASRLAAVQCEIALTEKLGEEWLALLPEMLPFISEGLEDDDEAVEREVQRWIVVIESILGESLDPMLQ